MAESDMVASRRGVLLGAGALGAGVALAACRSERSGEESGDSSAAASPSEPAAVLAADVPIGGGLVIVDYKIVVTQPEAGQFHAFSAVCTHKNCTVSDIANGTIDCPCHGSRFSATDGSVVTGPATKPLPAKTVTVQQDKLVIS